MERMKKKQNITRTCKMAARGRGVARSARGEVAATAHGEVAASRSILDVAKCGIFVYIIY